jgi:hypothetical protein
MKKTMLILLVMALVCVPAFAEGIHNTAGAKIDAPNLVKFTETLSLGLEGGKDIMTDVGYPSSSSYLEDDHGYFAYAKVTWTGSLLDFSKK